MTPEAFHAILAQTAPDAAHDAGHVTRVWTSCRRIAVREGGSSTILLAAAHLHDLVSLPKDHPDRAGASRLSAEAARPHLVHLGYAHAEVAAIAHAIEAHSFSAGIPPETLEARILQDADRLDGLGAIGLARLFTVSGALGRPLAHPGDPFAHHRPLDDKAWAIDHVAIKLIPMARTMQTATGAALALAALAPIAAWLAALSTELGQPLSEHFKTGTTGR